MKRTFFRTLHIVLAILFGLDILNISRPLSIIGSIALLISLFVMKEKYSGLTVRYKIIQELSILALEMVLGAVLLQKTYYLVSAAVFLIALIFEWKFRVFSTRWET